MILRVNSLVCGLLFTASVCTMVAAQEFGGSVKALEGAYDNRELNDYINGEKQPKKGGDPKAQKVAEAVANHFLWRITHPNPDPKKFKDWPVKVHSDFENFVTNAMQKSITTGKAKENRAFISILAPELIKSMHKILELKLDSDTTTTTVVVQGALMLPTMAKLRHDDIGLYLADLVDDSKGTHDAVRVYALRGLKEHLPITPIDNPGDLDNDKLQGLMNDAKVIDALTKYITRPMKGNGGPEQVKVKRYLRREAIAAMAHAGAPAVVALSKPQKITTKDAQKIAGKAMMDHEGLIAPTLLRVLANDLPLAPSLQEKIEAAYGICAMRLDKSPDYKSDVGVYLVGRLMQEMVSEYNKDWGNFAAAGDKRVPPTIAWKGESRRLSDVMQAQWGKGPNGKELAGKAGADLEAAVRPILASFGKYERPEQAKVIALNTLVNTLKPADGKAFKNLKTPPIPIK